MAEQAASERAVNDIELAIVTMRFDAADAAALLAVLAKYVVLTRMEQGCRNIDLCTGLLAAPPDIDLWDGPSAHDLR